MVTKKSKTKPAKKPKPPKKPKKPKEPKNPGDDELNEYQDKEVAFTRPELSALLLAIAQVSPDGSGSISQAQYDAVKQNLDKLFGEEPVILPPSETEGA